VEHITSMNDTDILKKSLNLISRFSDDVNLIPNSDEFIKIHNRNIESIKEIARERNSKFIISLIDQYPNINSGEIKQFISDEKKEVSLMTVTAGRLIGGIVKLIKNKGVSSSAIKKKMIDIKNLNEKLSKIAEDPIFEELYNK